MTELQSPKPSSGSTQPAVWVGVGLIALGALFLANNVFNIELLDNAWALILTFIGLLVLRNAWRNYRDAGEQLTSTVRGQGLIGASLILFSIMFLFDLDLGKFWPIILIVLGLLMLLRMPSR